ncbi:MAG: hypothetical protein FWF53_12105 [Candidatus Azobacteroides sp.]|nr:hypothetical protein [Candidatus Azobacteroides sp.]
MMKRLYIISRLFLGLAIMAGAGVVVLLLWNALIPSIFGWSAINFWQAMGLFVLCRILFGNFDGSRLFAWTHGYHKNPIREKWERMSNEEREKFIRHRYWDHRFHRFDPDYFKKEESEKHE